MAEASALPTVASSEAAENVQVVIRVRPLNKAEKDRGDRKCVECIPERDEILVPMSLKGVSPVPKKFTFDKVYDVAATQEYLFDMSVAPVVDEVLAGYSCTVFAYGQTGTGKTYTMEGKKEEGGSIEVSGSGAGIIARAVSRVFDSLATSHGDNHVKISFLEIYNEVNELLPQQHDLPPKDHADHPTLQRLDDLLAAEPSTFMADAKPIAKSGKERNLFGDGVSAPLAQSVNAAAIAAAAAGTERLKIVEDKRFGIRVQNLEEIPVKSADEVFAYVSRGIAKRATAETACNAQSSRSHCVFTMTIHMRESVDGEDVIRVGKLNLVDLAGSECVGRSGAKDARAREAGNINQSLLTLGRVITALVDHLPHIPYRDSKLTRLLQDSLGGRTKTCIIATLSPAAWCYDETLSTLEYANRAKNIKNRPEANARLEKRTLITAYAGEIETLKIRLASQIAKDGIFLPPEEYDGLHAKIRQLEYEIEELNALKAMNDEEISALRNQMSDLRDSLDNMTDRYTTTHASLVETTGRLEETNVKLDAEQVAHDESKVVLRAHAATEGTLTAQASAVLSTLRETVGDVKGLHSKVERTNSVLAFNKRSGDVYAQAAAQRMSALLGSTHEFANTQASTLAALTSLTASTAAKHATSTECIFNGINKLRGVVASFTKGVSASAITLDADVHKQYSTVTATVKACTEATTTDIASFQTAVEAALHEMHASLDSQSTMIQTWMRHQASFVRDTQAAVSQFSGHQTAAIQAIQLQISEHSNAMDAQLMHQQQALQTFEAERNKQASLASQSLANSLIAMVQQFTKEQTSATTTAVASLNGTVASMLDMSKEAHQQITAATSAAVNSVSTFAGTSKTQCALQEESVTKACKEADDFTHGMLDRVNASTTSASQQCAAMTQSCMERQTLVVASMEPLKTAASAFASRAKSTSVGCMESINKESDAAVQTLREQDSTISSASAEATALTQECGTSTQKHTDGVHMWVAAESTSMHGFFSSTLREPALTGATPVKREYVAPIGFMATSPADTILSRYRAAKEEGMATPMRDLRAFGRMMDVKTAVEAVSVIRPVEGHDGEYSLPTQAGKSGRVRGSSLSDETAAALLALASPKRDVIARVAHAATVSAVTAAAPPAPASRMSGESFASLASSGSNRESVGSEDAHGVIPEVETVVAHSDTPVSVTESETAEEAATMASLSEAPTATRQRRLMPTSKPLGQRIADTSDSAAEGRAASRSQANRTTLASRFGRTTSTAGSGATTPLSNEAENVSAVEAFAVSNKAAAGSKPSRVGSTSRSRTTSSGIGPRQTSKSNLMDV